MAGTVHIPWYATVFRGDDLAEALTEIAPIALRYGATEYEVFRSREDRYSFLHVSYFEQKLDFERYWYGREFSGWRADYSGWYQVPIVPGWSDVVVRDALVPERERTA